MSTLDKENRSATANSSVTPTNAPRLDPGSFARNPPRLNQPPKLSPAPPLPPGKRP